MQRALAGRVLERLPKLGELGLAADERRLQRSDRRPFAREVTQPPGGARSVSTGSPGRVRERAARSHRRAGSPRLGRVDKLGGGGHRFADDRH